MTTCAAYLTLPPTWSDGVKYRRKWRTGIQQSVTSGEIRSALYTWPRRGLSYRILNLSSIESFFLRRILFMYLSTVFGIPIWTDGTLLTAQAAAGQKVIHVSDTDNRDFAVGDDVILLHPDDPDTYEVKTIDAGGLAATQITVTVNLSTTWPIGTAIYPVMPARLSADQTVNWLSSRYSELSIEAEETYE